LLVLNKEVPFNFAVVAAAGITMANN